MSSYCNVILIGDINAMSTFNIYETSMDTLNPSICTEVIRYSVAVDIHVHTGWHFNCEELLSRI